MAHTRGLGRLVLLSDTILVDLGCECYMDLPVLEVERALFHWQDFWFWQRT